MIKHAQPSFSFNDFFRLLFRYRKPAGMYGLFFIIVSFNLGLFLPANMHNPAAERIINVVQLSCFGLMGIVNVWFFYKRNFLAELSLSGARLAFICLLFIIIALVLFVYYYVSGNNNLIMAFASSSAFLLPFLIYQGWIEFMGIPEKAYPVWRLPEGATGKVESALLSASHNLQFQLLIARRWEDKNEHRFPVTTSVKTKLGKVFERFIEDQRLHGQPSSIDTADEFKLPFNWQFFEERWAGLYRRNLNPAMSLQENNIKANTTIRAVRITNDAAGKYRSDI